MGFDLLLDGTNTSKPDGSNVYALNKVYEELRQNLKNEDGFKRILDDTGVGAVVQADPTDNFYFTGVISTPQAIIIFVVDEGLLGGKHSLIIKIEYTSKYEYTSKLLLKTADIVGEPGLHFTKENPIQGTFTFNTKGEIIIAFNEGVKAGANSLRYLNIDDLPFEVDSFKQPLVQEDILLIDSNRPLPIPIVELNRVSDSGGALYNGVYTIFIAYTDYEGNRTNFLASLNPVTIYYESSGRLYADIFDAPIDTMTGKAIHVDITGLSDDFNYLEIGVIYRTNGNDLAYTTTVPYTGSTTTVSITNMLGMETTSVSDIVINSLIYRKVNAITKFENQLIIGNVTTADRHTELQLVANDIIVKYTTIPIRSNLDTNPTNHITNTFKDNELIVNHKVFQPNEVYALYFQPLYTDGRKGEIYHIPGRVAIPNGYYLYGSGGNYSDEDATVQIGGAALPSNIDVNTYTDFAQGEKLGANVKLFQIRCTATEPYDVGVAGSGSLSFWENEHETYPTDGTFGAIGGQNVRHHKMPDFNKYSADLSSTNHKQEGLQLMISNVVIPAELEAEIQGYRILVAKRSSLNNLVVDEALLNHSPNNPLESDNITPATHSGGFKQVGGSSPFAQGDFGMEYGHIRLGDGTKFDMTAPNSMKYNNPLDYDYIKVEAVMQLDLVECAPSVAMSAFNFNTLGDTALIFDANYGSIQYINQESQLNLNYNDIFKMVDTFYCNQDGLYKNNANEVVDYTSAYDGIYCELDDGIQLLNVDMLSATSGAGQVTYDPGGADAEGYKSYSGQAVYGKAILLRYKEDVYDGFMEQSTFSVIEVIQNESAVLATECTVCGDSYISAVGVHRKVYKGKTSCVLPYCSATNFELRTPGDTTAQYDSSLPQPLENTYYTPVNAECHDLTRNWHTQNAGLSYPSPQWKWLDINGHIPEYWGAGARSIKRDWAQLNDYTTGVIYNPANTFLSHFPFRIAKSLPIQSESLFEGWRIFTYENYQDMDNSKGQIQTLDLLDRTLYVRQQFALYGYTVKDALEALNDSISLASKDIFHNRPEEIISDSLGYVGSNSRFNSLVTPYGYYVIDVVRKNIFKVIGSKAKDLKGGVIKFLNAHLDETFRNPYDEGDCVLGYNDVDKMALITNNIGVDHEFTLSLDMYDDTFKSFHSYIPTMYAQTIYDTITLRSQETRYSLGVYIHNVKPLKCLFYYDNAEVSPSRLPQPDILDVLQNTIVLKGKAGGQILNKILNYVAWNTKTSYYDVVLNEYVEHPEKTIDELFVYTDNQCTLRQQINIDNLDWYEVQHGDNIQNLWAFNNILDAVDNVLVPIRNYDYSINESNLSEKDYYEMSSFIGSFVVVRLINNNDTAQQYEQVINIVQANFDADKR